MLILETGFLVTRRSKKLPPDTHQKTGRFLGEHTCEMAGMSPPSRVGKSKFIATFGTEIS
ncbi:MAG TPA: hypothetical protein PKW52_15480 [Nitrospira sp.]|nr:hypothetical protein [Accumulibacter sp.]HQV12741.1 hypothetical protein [Nitrospira sp.]